MTEIVIHLADRYHITPIKFEGGFEIGNDFEKNN